MSTRNDANVPTHRYFDDLQATPKERRPLLTPRTIALISGGAAIAAAASAMLFAMYESIGIYIGFGLVPLGFVACAAARRADNSVRLIPAIAVSLLFVASSILASGWLMLQFPTPA